MLIFVIPAVSCYGNGQRFMIAILCSGINTQCILCFQFQAFALNLVDRLFQTHWVLAASGTRLFDVLNSPVKLKVFQNPFSAILVLAVVSYSILYHKTPYRGMF